MKGGRGRGGMPMRGGMMRGGGLMGLRWLLPIPMVAVFFLFMMMSGRGMRSPMFIVFIVLAALAIIGGGAILMQRRNMTDFDEKEKNSYGDEMFD